ncbi:MAG: xanthine dehydrogenase family protein molybdopterin-binding subunit [Burkholderiales bacterium]|nr:xanthine dehydrogenase family protein molybdopterin-binding subunit [Burkholderiales bacterium]
MARVQRREFVAGMGALVVSFAWLPAQAQPKKPAKLPGSLDKAPLLDGWLRIDADSRITVFTGKAELGQGIRTALIQLAAEELQVAPERITLVTADTALTPDEGYTAGSHSMQDSGTAIRHAAAQARALLLARAAERLGAAAGELSIANGVVSHGTRQLAYGELLGPEQLHVRVAPEVALRPPDAHRFVGRALPRVDIPSKVSGGRAYLQDMRLDGMVHGRIVRPPSARARLAALDGGAVERMPGVLKVVHDGQFLGVIARREWQAVQAMRALAAAARWDESAGPPPLPPSQALAASLRAAPAQDTTILERGMSSAPQRLSAAYSRPYLMHASIGPSCAIAQQLADGSYTAWSHSQGMFPLRKALAELLGLPEARLRCIHAEGSGCYGHNGADDVAADAALLARALPGHPVRVQWMREDEHGCEPYGPPMSVQVSGALDAAGALAEWDYQVWSNTHSTRPGGAGDLLAGTLLQTPFAPTPPKPLPQPEGGGDRNAIPLYTVPNARVVHHFLPQMPVRVSALRSLGAYMNVFAIESFMDELARAARADPVAFRLRHLQDPRAKAVVQLAAERFGWAAYRRSAMRGRGFAFARYKNLAAYLALACELEVRRDTGELRLLRVVAAVDSGEAVNPDGIRNQVEGGIVQSLSWTTVEQVAFDGARPASLDWGGYPILRFPNVPEHIDVHVVDRPGEPFLGTGEVAQGPTGAAVANALHDACGQRLRDLPLSRSRVRAALATAGPA